MFCGVSALGCGSIGKGEDWELVPPGEDEDVFAKEEGNVKGIISPLELIEKVRDRGTRLGAMGWRRCFMRGFRGGGRGA